MQYLPIFLKLAGQSCLVVGGGEVAARKVNALLRAKGTVTVLSPELGPELTAWLADGRIAHIEKRFEPADLAGFHLVISATDRREVNETVAAAARAQGIPVNVVDCPDLCSFIFPAIVDRSPVVIAVSTGGASPVLARLVRARLEAALPAAYGRLAQLAERCRLPVKRAIPDSTRRRRFWESTLQGGLAELIFSGRDEEAQARLLLLGPLVELLGEADGMLIHVLATAARGPVPQRPLDDLCRLRTDLLARCAGNVFAPGRGAFAVIGDTTTVAIRQMLAELGGP